MFYIKLLFGPDNGKQIKLFKSPLQVSFLANVFWNKPSYIMTYDLCNRVVKTLPIYAEFKSIVSVQFNVE